MYKIIKVVKPTDEKHVYTEHSGNIEFYSDAIKLLKYMNIKEKCNFKLPYMVDDNLIEETIRKENLQINDVFIVKTDSLIVIDNENIIKKN